MKIKLLIISIITLLLTGCSSYIELSDLSIVNSLGIDYYDNKYYLTLSLIEGKNDDQQLEKELTIYSASSTTLDGAFQKIYLTSSKHLYLSHIDLLIFSKNAVNNKLKDIIKNFLENNEYRNNFNVVILKDISISDFFKKKILAEDINYLLKTNEVETAITKIKDFENIMEELLIDGNTYLPTIYYKDGKLNLDGFTLINNYKVYEELTPEESIILNLLNNNTEKAYINNINILESSTKIATHNNEVNITIDLVINKNDKAFKSSLKNDIYDLVNKYCYDDYDILKLTERVRKNNYRYWKEQDNLLNKLKFNIEINTEVNKNYIKGDDFDE